MPARRSGYGQPNSHTRLADEDKSAFATPPPQLRLETKHDSSSVSTCQSCNTTHTHTLVKTATALVRHSVGNFCLYGSLDGK
eukprot:195412-Chlamydomonas_euryale.AAC.1